MVGPPRDGAETWKGPAWGAITALPHNLTMPRSRSKSAIIDAAFQRWIRNPSDPETHAVALSVQ